MKRFTLLLLVAIGNLLIGCVDKETSIEDSKAKALDERMAKDYIKYGTYRMVFPDDQKRIGGMNPEKMRVLKRAHELRDLIYVNANNFYEIDEKIRVFFDSINQSKVRGRIEQMLSRDMLKRSVRENQDVRLVDPVMFYLSILSEKYQYREPLVLAKGLYQVKPFLSQARYDSYKRKILVISEKVDSTNAAIQKGFPKKGQLMKSDVKRFGSYSTVHITDSLSREYFNSPMEARKVLSQ